MTVKAGNPAQARIDVLRKHFASAQVAEVSSILESECAGPAFARPIAIATRFARPVGHSAPLNHAQPLSQVRIPGPAYQPTKPGTFSRYEERASAAPKFARPCDSIQAVQELKLEQQQNGKPKLQIAECKAGYQMEMALPGMSAGEITLELQGNDIVVIGRRAMSGKRPGLPSALFRSSTRLPNELDTTSVRVELINGLLLIKARKKHGC